MSGSFVRRTAIWVPAGVIGLLMLPLAVTKRSFGIDWTLHLWMVRQQQWNIEAMGHPGLFISVGRLGAFYPIFAYVGSGIYAVGGYLSILLGDRPLVAYKLLYLGGLCLGYGGMTWLSLLRGLRGWRSQIAGLVFVTGYYMVVNLTPRGDMGEFVALAAIPFLLAATYAVLTAPITRVRYLLAVVVGVFVFTGSHNITLLWGGTFVVAMGVIVFVAYNPRWSSPVPWKRVGALVGAAAIGMGLNAWYLFPDFAYGLDTAIAKVNHGKIPAIIPRIGFPFDPLRRNYPIRVVVPWMFVVWALYVAFATWRVIGAAFKRLFVGVFALGTVYVVFCVSRSSWTVLPKPFWNVQFARRLDAEILLATALLVILALEWQRWLRDSALRASSVALVVISVFTVGLATRQAWNAPSRMVGVFETVPAPKNLNAVVVRSRHVIPPSWYSRGDFNDLSAPVVAAEVGRRLTVPYPSLRGSSFTGVLDVPDGPAPFSTNISGGPRFVRMTGIRAVGRSPGGFVVAERAPDAPATGPITVSIRQADSAVLLAGTIVSAVSLFALVGLLVWALWRFLRTHARRLA